MRGSISAFSLLIDSLSRSFIQKMIKEGSVTVNGIPVKGSYRVCAEDSVVFCLPKAVEPDIVPEAIPLDILYEDDDVIVVNKPKGMVVHPAAGHYSGTLVNALMYHCGDSLSGINGVMRPGIVHRIDRNTSGVIVVAKNDIAHRGLAEQFFKHSIERTYYAFVYNVPNPLKGVIEGNIARSSYDRKKNGTCFTRRKNSNYTL